MQILCFYLIFQPTAFKVEKHHGKEASEEVSKQTF